jgi:hypothetical protein
MVKLTGPKNPTLPYLQHHLFQKFNKFLLDNILPGKKQSVMFNNTQSQCTGKWKFLWNTQKEKKHTF